MPIKLEPEAKLIHAAMHLRHLAQPEYEVFVAALLDRTRRMADKMVEGDPEHLRYLQGRAVELKELTELLNNIAASHKKLSEIKKGQTP